VPSSCCSPGRECRGLRPHPADGADPEVRRRGTRKPRPSWPSSARSSVWCARGPRPRSSASSSAGSWTPSSPCSRQIGSPARKSATPGHAGRELMTPWFRSFITHDPAQAIRRVRVPVLALYGGRDLQVEAAQNLPPLRAAWPRRQRRRHAARNGRPQSPLPARPDRQGGGVTTASRRPSPRRPWRRSAAGSRPASRPRPRKRLRWPGSAGRRPWPDLAKRLRWPDLPSHCATKDRGANLRGPACVYRSERREAPRPIDPSGGSMNDNLDTRTAAAPPPAGAENGRRPRGQLYKSPTLAVSFPSCPASARSTWATTSGLRPRRDLRRHHRPAERQDRHRAPGGPGAGLLHDLQHHRRRAAASLYNQALDGLSDVRCRYGRPSARRLGGRGLALIVVACLLLARTVWDVDMDWMEDWWPAGLLLLARGSSQGAARPALAAPAAPGQGAGA